MKSEVDSKPAERTSGQLSSSPCCHRRRQLNNDQPSRNSRPGVDAPLLRAPWPSSFPSGSTKNTDGASTLADQLRHDRLADLLDRLNGGGRLSSEGDGENSNENRRVGGSMRYTTKTGKLHSAKSPLSSSTFSMAAAAVSVDEKGLRRRHTSDSRIDIPSWESDSSDSTVAARRSTGSSPRFHTATTTQISRSRSAAAYRSTSSRRESSPGKALQSEDGNKQQPQPSSGQPSSPPKARGKGGKVGGLMISLGLGLFQRKSSSSPPTSPLVIRGEAARDAAHQLRMCSNRVLQWRFVNARSEESKRRKMMNAEEILLSAWARLRMVQSTVVQKRMQLEKGKLELRLHRVLSSQMRSLVWWGDMEKRHSSAVSATGDCLQAATCRVPVADGAKADTGATLAVLRWAMDLIRTIRATISLFSPMAQNTAPLLSELAVLVVEERSLIDECFELLTSLSTRQIQEWSLKCHIIQLKSQDRASTTRRSSSLLLVDK